MKDDMATRVGRAMAENAGFCWENCAQSQWVSDARAGIKAMREPTQAMIDDHKARAYNYGLYGDKEVRRIWSAMIDAALMSEQQRPDQDRRT
jgi:hypothetical protein